MVLVFYDLGLFGFGITSLFLQTNFYFLTFLIFFICYVIELGYRIIRYRYECTNFPPIPTSPILLEGSHNTLVSWVPRSEYDSLKD